ncbi:MAG TPA: ATP-dependent DNA helicase RecG [Candidatus Limnocylindria bacterium]|nr:ATP-dependent DNA helicase RecG [Candidatus Limnocylindria bacterium]
MYPTGVQVGCSSARTQTRRPRRAPSERLRAARRPRSRLGKAVSRTTHPSSRRSDDQHVTVRTTPSAPRTSLDLPVSALPGVGAESAKLLERLEIRTIGDLLWHLPARYIDYSTFRPLRALRADEEQSAIAILGAISQRRTARGQQLTEAQLLDEDGAPTGVTASWFGRQFIKERVREGQRVRISGKVGWFGRTLQFRQPKIEPADAQAVHTGRMVPVYRLTEGLKEGNLRRWLHTAVEGGPRRTPVVRELADALPSDVRERRELLPLPEAMAEVHFPSSEGRLFAARRRLAFDELLVLQLALGQRRAHWKKDAKALPLRADDRRLDAWIRALPFTLTADQERAFAEIRADIAKAVPMARLLQGEVGSGKTVVAALAMRIAVESGAQASLMAPTELLAEQHATSLRRLLPDAEVGLLTSSTPAAERRRILDELASGRLGIVVGTHALVEERVAFERLALAIVDEQHRFGVRQRTTLREKGIDPHLLLTTATPIPQTLWQTVYRDLDVSAIRELPRGRQEIRTEVRTSAALPKVWPWLRERVAAGEQAFVVCPRIDPGEDPDAPDVPSAVAVERELRTGPLAGLRVALLHGRMPAKERDDVMRRFAAGEIDVLVATTVIEVGIDVPNATVMVVLGAERFGLAQLHQLRGRVGRGEKRAFAVLVSEAAGESERLAAMTERTPDGAPLDGFALAQRDLEIRGPGEFLGERQSGVPELRIVDLADLDPRLLADVTAEADRILATDTDLERPEHALLAEAVRALWRRTALA